MTIIKGHPSLIGGFKSGKKNSGSEHFVTSEVPRVSPTKPRSVILKISDTLACPALSPDKIELLNLELPPRVTKHIDGEHLQKLKDGAFRIGTLKIFRPADDALNVGRFGDWREGTQRDIFKSRSRYFHIKDRSVGSATFRNVIFKGAEHPFMIEYQINDYCWCSTIGDYDEKCALTLRSKGNGGLSAAVTYDAAKLVSALGEILNEMTELGELSLIGQPVKYGQKDRTWEIETEYDIQPLKDAMAVYLSTAFVKSPAYKHEHEYRLLLAAPSALGRLPMDAGYLDLQDPRIAAAITGCHEF